MTVRAHLVDGNAFDFGLRTKDFKSAKLETREQILTSVRALL
jgi:hypothetical protein